MDFVEISGSKWILVRVDFEKLETEVDFVKVDFVKIMDALWI